MDNKRLTADDFKVDNAIPQHKSKSKVTEQSGTTDKQYIGINDTRQQPEPMPTTFNEKVKYLYERGLTPIEIGRKLNLGWANETIAYKELLLLGFRYVKEQ